MSTVASVLVDGSILEGGGQLLRNAVAFSALLSKPIHVEKIRDNRKPPGLKAQHAAGIRLAAEICSARLAGGQPGSRALSFSPGPIQLGRTYTADPGTAGATTLLLQLALPLFLFSADAPDAVPTTLTLHGGTHAAHAPQAEFTQHVLLPFLRTHLGLAPTLEIRRRGYYPKGGGKLIVTVPPVRGPLPAFCVRERGDVRRIRGRAYVAGVLPVLVARKMADGARETLLAGAGPSIVPAGASDENAASVEAGPVRAAFDPALVDLAIDVVQEAQNNAVGTGSGIVLWAETELGCVLGASAVGAKGRDPRKVGKEAADELLRMLRSGGCVDEHLQDQMIIFMALAEGTSIVKTGPLTLHTRTAIWFAEKLAGAKFEIDESEPGCAIIQCTGIGFRPSEDAAQGRHEQP